MNLNEIKDSRPRTRTGALRTVPCSCLRMRPSKEQATDAFAREGMVVADFEVECIFLANVMTECGKLYTYEGSHGGGQIFTFEGLV
jgi:hypothetical protein